MNLPTFDKAVQLFKEGWRLTNWGAALTDTFEEITLININDKSKHGYWADGTNRHTEQVFEIIGIEESDENEDVLTLLSKFTELEVD